MESASSSNPPAARRRPPRRTTLVEVARAAGVAPATVSGILNDRADCYASQETRKRVEDLARTLGYRPNSMARALAGKPTATLGLVVPGFDVEMTSLKLTGFEAAARRAAHMTIAACTQNRPELEDQAIEWLMDRCVDAIAVYPTEYGDHVVLRQLIDDQFPVVTFDGRRLGLATDDVTVDCFAGGRLQAEHLLSLGRRRVAIINGRTSCHIVDQKIAGLEAGMRDAGAPAPVRSNLNLDTFNQEHWRVADLSRIDEFVRDRGGEFDAIMAVGDSLGMATIRGAIEAGLRVPDDLAVIGYDGAALASQSLIPLTTIHHASEEIGRMAFDLLGERLAGSVPTDQPRQLLIPPMLIRRASTGS